MEKAKLVLIVLMVAMAAAMSSGGHGTARIAEASPPAQIATMETLFSPAVVRLPKTGDSARVNIETLFGLDGTVWLAVFNIKHDPNLVQITSFRCEGFLSDSIRLGPIPKGGNTLMGCLRQPGEAVDINSTIVASFTVARVGSSDTQMSFELEGSLGTQFHSFHRGKLIPGKTNQLKIFGEEVVAMRELARGSHPYLQGQGPKFLYFNANAEWTLANGLLGTQGAPNFSNETVGLLVGGVITKIVKNSAGGLDIYVSPLNGGTT